ncbi:hypothetical protein COT44_04345 [Candidatus Shapirobacteria bacterium CG08_land_8_20_14_0_20_39_18]|uniref:Baseplate protein J-like domain-containing protein n=1 Tax=Candidatus Shapirobacteria bacterium CG08_land_8_20_14_0_20_39_18 TaxID=1974883 RepID=A0A2M6XC97_9BACT|nr:MAG: hypothetical protein COT44_04345 [Candidatus Shapirobacteria bacterium CG08_land_8_20_14_0_20_39_18]PIY66371.1 MAG: hypothetical protein COY91_00320 [Candidatus Shapirobacteria bacterium CG_4_10_14_0_8_um_filter_39_15]PJE68051.1 MAG: hypothetical protein COU94_03800 [Candidatus Shapirobacteria bacterium CG10_big_fil_rev_8_21_14_0_10_38_8]
MELPNFLNKITHSADQKKREYFLALEIWDEGVKSAIWTIEDGKSRIVSFGTQETWTNTEDLVTAADLSLSSASQTLAEAGIEPTKVIFGLADDWIRDNKILPDYQNFLSEIREKLELTPTGFVSVFDALIPFMKEKEGAPLTAILVNPGKKFVNLAVVEVGKIKGVQKISRSENLAADVYEGLLRCADIEVLPSRILLYDGVPLEDQKQVLLANPWLEAGKGEKKLPFLHFPKIEILPPNSDIEAIALMGGNEVAKSLGWEEPIVSTVAEVPEPDLGFIKGEDVRQLVSADQPVSEPELVEVPTYYEETLPVEEKPKRSFKIKFSKVTFPHLPSLPNKSFLIIGLVVFLLLAGIGLAAFWILPKADVIVYVTPKTLNQEIPLTIDPNQEAIGTNDILPGQVVETRQDGEKTITTTGQKTVGDKAKGEVTVYNRTESPKTFPSGTVVVGPGGLKFSLDREVSVASKTADLVSGVDKWGESKVTVTAIDIGAQYNLAPQSQFSFKDFSNSLYLAKNDLVFGGGTSRQVMAVADKDQQDLQKNLTDELLAKAGDSLNAKVGNGLTIVKESFINSPVSINFNHKIGDEAQDLTLKLTIKVSAMFYKQDDLYPLLLQALADSIPAGYESKKEDLKSEFQLVKKNDDGSITFNDKVTSNLIPKIDITQLVKTIEGKSKIQAMDLLKSNVPGFTSVQITIKPSFLAAFQRISSQPGRINLEIRRQ